VYLCDRDTIVTCLESLLAMPVLQLEGHPSVVELCRLGTTTDADFSDLLIGLHTRSLGSGPAITFDRSAARSELFEKL